MFIYVRPSSTVIFTWYSQSHEEGTDPVLCMKKKELRDTHKWRFFTFYQTTLSVALLLIPFFFSLNVILWWMGGVSLALCQICARLFLGAFRPSSFSLHWARCGPTRQQKDKDNIVFPPPFFKLTNHPERIKSTLVYCTNNYFLCSQSLIYRSWCLSYQKWLR